MTFTDYPDLLADLDENDMDEGLHGTSTMEPEDRDEPVEPEEVLAEQ